MDPPRESNGIPAFNRPTSRAEFRIAVICAKTIEANAVEALFDGFYDEDGDQYGKAPGDPNAYTTGRIGQNHVVLAHMPGMGKGIASSVASYFKISYPGIELAMLVGICSGVPYGDDGDGFSDIFLGDVIVSDGLVQYDLGKRVPDQFMRKDTLRDNLGRPNQQIRSLLAMLRTDRRRALLSDRLSRYLTVIEKKAEKKAERRRAGYPGAQKDRLFDPSYRHKHHAALCDICGNNGEGPACYRALSSTCAELDCEENMVIRRRNHGLQPPKQAVHFGVMASGDTLVMSGQDRDRIASGEDIIGFETEGAGVWDNLPCIVVKGVCDYADSHRNKEWQAFAAATAAACMRALLDERPISTTSSLTRSIQDEGFHPSQNPCRELIQSNCHMGLDQQKSDLNLLTFPQTGARLQNIDKAHEDTCLWLLEQMEYQDWLSPEQSNLHGGFLWIKGKPGAGKSTMMKHIFMHTKEKVNDAIVLSFFFNARGGDLEKSTLGMYRSLLFQLLTALPLDLRRSYFDAVSGKQQLSERFQWNHRELQMILSSTIQRLHDYQLFFFIDAIDECEERHARDMISFLEGLGRCAVSPGLDLKICLASRHYPHISIDRGIELIMEDQKGHETDIRKYVNSKLKAGQSRKIEEIKAEICQRAAGVFLWVVLVVRMLNEAFDHGRVQAVRQRLSEIPDELDDLFTDILTRDDKDKEDLVFCLQWILFAQRPLTREELYFAIWFQKSRLLQRDEEHTQQVIERFILSASKGLAEVTRSKDHTVQFIHESVRDFFLLRDGWTRLQPSLKENPAGLSHDKLRRCCFRYLQRLNENYRQLLNILAVHAEREKKESIKAKIPFMEYAIQSLLFHADSAESRGISQRHFLNALSDQFADFIAANNAMERFSVRCYKKSVRPLYVLSEKGFGHLIQLHLEMGADVSIALGRFGSPINVAVYNGNITAIRALLRCELRRTPSCDEDELLEPELVTRMKQYLVQISRTNPNQVQTLITYAFQRKHRIIFKLLVEAAEIDLNFQLRYEHTPLTWAIAHNHQDLVKDLLNTGKVDINIRFREDHVPLKMAVYRRQKHSVETLLGDDSLDHNYQDEHGQNAVLWAADRGDEDTMQLILQFPTFNVGHRDHQGRDALSIASERGKPMMVQMLLGLGVFDVDAKDNNGRSPLSWAAGNGFDLKPVTDKAPATVIALLLSTDSVDVNSKDNSLRTPLSWAVRTVDQAAVELLLNIPTVDVDCKDIAGHTPFSIASIMGFKDIMKLLLRTGKVDINSQDTLGRTPLSWAAGPWLPDETPGSFLYNRTDRECVMKIILSTGAADVDRKDVLGRKPLWWALTSDYIVEHPQDGNSAAIVKLLKDHVPSQDESKVAEMQRLLARTEPDLVEDILATSKLYRPVDGITKHFRSVYTWGSGRIGTGGVHSRNRR